MKQFITLYKYVQHTLLQEHFHNTLMYFQKETDDKSENFTLTSILESRIVSKQSQNENAE